MVEDVVNFQRLVGLSFFSTTQNAIRFYLASPHVRNNASEGENLVVRAINTIIRVQGDSLRGRVPPPATLIHKEIYGTKKRMKRTERSTILGAN